MDGNITVKYLQDYLRQKDFKPGQEREYFLKLAEETGELARAMRRGLRPAGDIRGSIDEELWDVIYYALAIANCYGIDMESVIPKKAAFNAQRYPDPEPFTLDR